MSAIFRLFPLALVSLWCAAALAAPPQFVRLSWDRPDTEGNITVTWNTNIECPSEVRYGIGDMRDQTATGICYQSREGMGWLHEVTLEGLESGVEYSYVAGDPMSWSDPKSFIAPTAPDGCEPIRFVVLGDNRSDNDDGPSPKWSPIFGEAIADGPNFALNTGDLVQDGDVLDQWIRFLSDTWEHASQVPLMPSLGNHDDDDEDGDNAYYNHVFTLPSNDVTGTEDYYYFTYGPAVVVCLSTATFKGGTTPFQEQADWLDQVLTDNPKPWKFVFFHHPPYTGAADIFGWDVNHPSNEVDQNPAFGPIFDKHHVDIVFNGHNHFYQRFAPMQYDPHNGETGIPVDEFADGTVYVVTGGAGAMTYNLIEGYMWGLNQFTTGSEFATGRHHYVEIEIDQNHLTYRAIATAQQILGSNPDNVEMFDSFEVYKDEELFDCTPPVTEPDAGSDVGEPDAGSAPDVPTVEPDVPVVEPDVPVVADVPVAPDQSVKPDVPAQLDVTTEPDHVAVADPGGEQPPTVRDDSGGSSCTAGTGGNGAPIGVLAFLLLLALLWKRQATDA